MERTKQFSTKLQPWPDGKSSRVDQVGDCQKTPKTARERFDRQLGGKLPDIFTALFEAGTKEKDTAALSLLVNRAVPVRKGVPVNFKTRPLSNPGGCAEACPAKILTAIGRGELTPDEGNMIGALIERRANSFFQTVELQDEIAVLKATDARPRHRASNRCCAWSSEARGETVRGPPE